MKRQGLYEASIGLGKESYKYKNEWLNDDDRYFGTIGMDFWKSPSLRYLIASIEYPKDLSTELDRTFSKHTEDIYRNLGSTFRTKRVLYSKGQASTLSDEVFQDEEEAKSSTQSIRIYESLIGVTPSPVAPKVHEIYDISYSHMDDPEEYIRISIIE